MKENYNIVKKILVPVNFDDASLAIAKQAAELAKDHDAVLHLLHVIDRETMSGYYPFTNFTRRASCVSLANQRNGLLQTWQRSMQILYDIRIETSIGYEKWEKSVLAATTETEADLVVLPKPGKQGWKSFFYGDPIESVIQKSTCQVVTFFSESSSIHEWKNIVIPVQGFIPELRIKTIFRIARKNRIKIHLITLNQPVKDFATPQFPFIVDTLKMLKSAGNIQIQCSCIKRNKNAEHSFIEYANSVHADALMTNKRIKGNGLKNFWQNTLSRFLQFNSFEPGTTYQPSM
ncbi:MAG: universal stress protein [Sediminibacterium sp.]